MPENWNAGVSYDAPGYYAVGNTVTFGKASSPKLGNITTNVVRLKAGYVGQVLVDGVIVHELKPRKTSSKALLAANARVARRLAAVLS